MRDCTDRDWGVLLRAVSLMEAWGVLLRSVSLCCPHRSSPGQMLLGLRAAAPGLRAAQLPLPSLRGSFGCPLPRPTSASSAGDGS